MSELSPETLADVERIVAAWEKTACSQETGAKFRAVLNALAAEKVDRVTHAAALHPEHQCETFRPCDCGGWHSYVGGIPFRSNHLRACPKHQRNNDPDGDCIRELEAALAAEKVRADKAERDLAKSREYALGQRVRADMLAEQDGWPQAAAAERRALKAEQERDEYVALRDRWAKAAQQARARLAALEAGIKRLADMHTMGGMRVHPDDLRALIEKGDDRGE